jgi:hypothetical protein
VEGPTGVRCGWELRGRAGDGGEDARRCQASSRRGGAGGAEGACGGRGQWGAAGRDGGGDARRGGGEERKGAVLLDWAVHSLKPGVFEELMEMMG